MERRDRPLLLSLSFSQIFHKAAKLYSNGRGTDAETLGLSWTKDLCLPSLSITPGHFEGVTSDLRLVLDELRARVAKLHLPKFRNEKFPSPRQIYNQV